MTRERKEKFHNKYKDDFGTSTIEETYAVWASLLQEERKALIAKKTSERFRKWHTEHKEEFSKAMMGHAVSEEAKQKLSDRAKKYYERKENRLKTAESVKAAFSKNPRSKETILKQSESLRRTYQEKPELKKQISESMKLWHRNNPGVTSYKTRLAMQKFYQTERGQENLKKWTDGSRAKGTSNPEKELQNFIRTFCDKNIVLNNRTLLDGKELDIVSLDKNIAVEHHGNIWHSEAFKKDEAKTCHLSKLLLCREKGIKLLQFFSDEWENKKRICEAIILSIFKKFFKKYKLEHLNFKPVSQSDAELFFEENSVFYSSDVDLYFGLYDSNNLVQCIAVKENTKFKFWKITGLATLINHYVDSSFIFNNIIREAKKFGMEYIEFEVDSRLAFIDEYIDYGFKVIKNTKPKFFYTNGKVRIEAKELTRQKCIEKWPEFKNCSLTSRSMCFIKHFYRIYDCGTIILRLDLE
mgnify:FL=1